MEGGQDGPLGRAGEGKEGVWLAEEGGVEEKKKKKGQIPTCSQGPSRRVVHPVGKRRITATLQTP
jgi:hypothetical protein